MPSITRGIVELDDTRQAFASKSDKDLKQAYRLFRSFNNPVLYGLGKLFSRVVFSMKMPVSILLKGNVYKQFCGGETITACEPVIRELARHQISTALQYSVETKSSEQEYYRTATELVKAIDYARTDKSVGIVCCKITGIGSFELLEKRQSGITFSMSEKKEWEELNKRLEKICAATEMSGVSVFVDAEESWIQRPIDELVEQMMIRFNRSRATVYNTFQLYRTDQFDFLKASHQKAMDGSYILGAKLVRGAYMEKERERAANKDYASPVFRDKASTDSAFNAALQFCVGNYQSISICAATHNEISCKYLTALIDEHEIPRDHPHVFFSQLYGMGDHLTYNLALAGFNAAKLIPYGPVMEAIPYLIRRAEENSSVAGQVDRELQLIRKEILRRGMSA